MGVQDAGVPIQQPGAQGVVAILSGGCIQKLGLIAVFCFSNKLGRSNCNPGANLDILMNHELSVCEPGHDTSSGTQTADSVTA